MPFLTLNGWTVPVATCTADHNLTGGGERRAFDGTFHRHSLGVKRTWQVKTQLLPYTDLDTLRAIVGWQGIYIPLDTSLASSSGLLPRPTAHATLVPTVAADGYPVQADFGQDAVVFGPGWQNLLLPGQVSMQSGFININGATNISGGTASVFAGYGARQVHSRVGPGGTPCGLEFGARPITGGREYTASAYVRGSGAIRVRMVADPGGVLYFGEPTTLDGSRWQRLVWTGTMAPARTSVRMQVVDVANEGGTFWVAAPQLEVDFPHPWTASASAASQLTYDSTDQTLATGLTMMARIAPRTFGNTDSEIILAASDPADPQSYVRLGTVPQGSHTPQVQVATAGRPVQTVVPDLPAVFHVAVVVDPAQGAVTVYADGQVVALAGAFIPRLDALTQIDIGSLAGASPFDGAIGGVLVLPVVAAPDFVAAVAAAPASEYGRLPMVRLGGDAAEGAPADVVGSVPKFQVQAHRRPGGIWEAAGGVATFTLVEV